MTAGHGQGTGKERRRRGSGPMDDKNGGDVVDIP